MRRRVMTGSKSLDVLYTYTYNSNNYHTFVVQSRRIIMLSAGVVKVIMVTMIAKIALPDPITLGMVDMWLDLSS